MIDKSISRQVLHRVTYCDDLISRSAEVCVFAVTVFNGVGTNFGVGAVEEARPEGPRARDGVLGRGQPAPPHQLGGLRER